jgi:lipoprotein-anchoring transpeptidase ErfK/SrfK
MARTRRLLVSALAATLAGPLAVAATDVASAPAAHASTSCSAPTTSHQMSVERYLGRPVDGHNGRGDCLAIKVWQHYHSMYVTGSADYETWRLTRRVTKARSRMHYCPRHRLVLCVDLTSQMIYRMERGRLTFGPFAGRSGRNHYETRTGMHRIYYKDKDHVSSIYRVPMPWSMFFSGGQAIHYTDRYLYNHLGSHGCVQVSWRRVRYLYYHAPVGTRVYIFGRKPGT